MDFEALEDEQWLLDLLSNTTEPEEEVMQVQKDTSALSALFLSVTSFALLAGLISFLIMTCVLRRPASVAWRLVKLYAWLDVINLMSEPADAWYFLCYGQRPLRELLMTSFTCKLSAFLLQLCRQLSAWSAVLGALVGLCVVLKPSRTSHLLLSAGPEGRRYFAVSLCLAAVPSVLFSAHELWLYEVFELPTADNQQQRVCSHDPSQWSSHAYTVHTLLSQLAPLVALSAIILPAGVLLTLRRSQLTPRLAGRRAARADLFCLLLSAAVFLVFSSPHTLYVLARFGLHDAHAHEVHRKSLTLAMLLPYLLLVLMWALRSSLCLCVSRELRVQLKRFCCCEHEHCAEARHADHVMLLPASRDSPDVSNLDTVLP